MSEVKCKKCGCEIEEGMEYCSKCSEKKKKSILKIKKFLVIIGIAVLIAALSITIVIIHNKVQREKEAAEQERYNNLPIKVDISMTSYFGNIEYILYELDLDFDLVTMGANCYTGVQKGEFRYCKSNYTKTFRVYNDMKDQELRDPKPGELAEFDKYGEKITNNNTKNGL